jgi:hypothetical protein
MIMAGEPSFRMAIAEVEAFVTERSGMLAPVTFLRGQRPVQPYSISPWAEEELPGDTPAIIRVLRGDFMCSDFGGNEEPFRGRNLGIHGDTANAQWACGDFTQAAHGACLTLDTAMPARGGHCVKRTALIEGHNIVYQRHDFTGVDGPLNPGHHATVKFPAAQGSGRLAFSPFKLAHTYVEPAELPEKQGYSWLKPDAPVADLTAVPCIDGSTADVTRYPARRGFEDIMIVCADPALELAWSSATFAAEGYVWFTLRDPRVLPSTVLWMSNGGRYYAPWSGRHVNVMGIEDMTGFFHVGLAASARENKLNAQGIVTSHQLSPEQTFTVNYIQGVAAIPEDFDVVAGIRAEDAGHVTLTAASGARVTVPCAVDFIHSGTIDGLISSAS